jgi:hypothetical protein
MAVSAEYQISPDKGRAFVLLRFGLQMIYCIWPEPDKAEPVVFEPPGAKAAKVFASNLKNRVFSRSWRLRDKFFCPF